MSRSFEYKVCEGCSISPRLQNQLCVALTLKLWQLPDVGFSQNWLLKPGVKSHSLSSVNQLNSEDFYHCYFSGPEKVK